MIAFIFVLKRREKAKSVDRKLNVAAFQCNHKGNYKRNVNDFKNALNKSR